MKIGIYTYGTRGDVQPYIALALGLMKKGHEVTLSAPSDFREFVEGFGVTFQGLYGNAESLMNSPEGQRLLQSENTIKMMKYYFKVLNEMRVPLRKSYFDAISKVDYIIANSMTLPIVSAIVEKQNKKMAATYFMPPVIPTAEFPVSDFALFNFGWYNKFTYKIAHYFYWLFVKKETNEYRQELGLPILKENLITHIEKQKLLDLYCISPLLIPQPKDWDAHHKITGFLTIPSQKRETHIYDKIDISLSEWLLDGMPPIYMGFGSNGIGNKEKFIDIINDILNTTDERVLFCTGWSSIFDEIPQHKNLHATKYVNHEAILPKCKIGIFHGGAGTLAAMLRNNLPLIIISFYTDQPAWGKIIEDKKLGKHISLKSLTADKLKMAIQIVQNTEIKTNVLSMGASIRNENGLDNAINEIEKYFAKR
jgi:sterol 3beta-glucosyltransferase